ncbi:hypothetical protein [Thalassotalea sp. PLHSN55]
MNKKAPPHKQRITRKAHYKQRTINKQNITTTHQKGAVNSPL